LIRAGPLPFIQRLINGDEYEQGVLKMMAMEGCDRKVRLSVERALVGPFQLSLTPIFIYFPLAFTLAISTTS
jgi:hypothetical protein